MNILLRRIITIEVKHSRGCVYALEYHIVWCTKYRHKVLTPDVLKSLICTLNFYAKCNNFEIIEVNGDTDHIHLLVSTQPNACIPQLIQGMKGFSTYKLFKIHPEIKAKLYGGHLWSPSYFIATVSENTEAQIRKYIQMQQEKSNGYDVKCKKR